MDNRLLDIVEAETGDVPNPNGILMRGKAKYEWYFANGIKLEAAVWDSPSEENGDARELEYLFTDTDGTVLDDGDDEGVERFVGELLASEGEPFGPKHTMASPILRAVVLAIMRDKAQEYAHELGSRAEAARSETVLTEWTIAEIARTGGNDIQSFWGQLDSLSLEAATLDMLCAIKDRGAPQGAHWGHDTQTITPPSRAAIDNQIRAHVAAHEAEAHQ